METTESRAATPRATPVTAITEITETVARFFDRR
jgi:hypothetical protein